MKQNEHVKFPVSWFSIYYYLSPINQVVKLKLQPIIRTITKKMQNSKIVRIFEK